MSYFKKSSKKYTESEISSLDRLEQYKQKLEQTREIMNNVIRQAVYRDAELDINRQFQKERINGLKEEISILNEENLDLRERLDYYERMSDEPPSIIYMDFTVRNGNLYLDSAYQNHPENQIIIQASDSNGNQNKEYVAIDISWD